MLCFVQISYVCTYSIPFMYLPGTWSVNYNHTEYVGVICITGKQHEPISISILMYNNNTYPSKLKELLLFDYIPHQ